MEKSVHLPTSERIDGYPTSTLRFDTIIVLLSAVFVTGIYVDGWAHNTFPNLIETFFTPYHALLYGGFFMAAGVLCVTAWQNHRLGYAWSRALPQAYLPALLGVALFMFGGNGDLLWHEIFGFEEDIEALLSPTHLLLLVGGLLIVSAPLRAVWQRPNGNGWRELFPALLSLLLVISAFTFFTQYTHLSRVQFLTAQPYDGFDRYAYTVIVIYGQVMPFLLATGGILLLMRRWQLPFGTITLLVGGNYLAMFLMLQRDSFAEPATLGAVFLGGIIGDGLYRSVNPSPRRPQAVRLFAFLLPFLLSGLFLLSLLATSTIWWAIHMWAGVPILIGLLGILLSFLAVPLPLPEDR